MSIDLKISGLVLAGGTSQRMGQDKAQLRLNGSYFLDIACEHLKLANVEKIHINNADNLADILPNLGPLGGIYTAFVKCPKIIYWLIIPNDMPLLTHDILTALQTQLGDADMVRFEGEMFPLLLKKSPAMHQHLTKLANDEARTYSIRKFMQPFDIKTLEKPNNTEAAFTNINSPEDYQNICG